MAKAKDNTDRKVSFGKRKGGRAKKFNSPKDKKTKPYKSQGRG